MALVNRKQTFKHLHFFLVCYFVTFVVIRLYSWISFKITFECWKKKLTQENDVPRGQTLRTSSSINWRCTKSIQNLAASLANAVNHNNIRFKTDINMNICKHTSSCLYTMHLRIFWFVVVFVLSAGAHYSSQNNTLLNIYMIHLSLLSRAMHQIYCCPRRCWK